jgi:hypothetical protein
MFFWLNITPEVEDHRLPLYAAPPLPPPELDKEITVPSSVRGFEEINFDIDDFCTENFVHTIVHNV